jgi:hypothetical protein
MEIRATSVAQSNNPAWYFLVRPLGFEPRTCGLRVGSELFLVGPDRPGQAHYQGLQSLTVSDRPRLSRQ